MLAPNKRRVPEAVPASAERLGLWRTTLFEALVIAVSTPFPYDGTVQRVRGCSRQMSVLVALDTDDVLF
jgi:hypothetical protein